MPSDFLEDKVVEHFTGAADFYSQREGIVHPEADPVILDFILRAGPGSVLEVGGGNGYLLDLIANSVGAAELVNCELTYRAYQKQANTSIKLVGGNVIKLPFAESIFDYVIIKNLLHHLVGPTRKVSKKLARAAVDELFRVTRSGGKIIVLEQFHQYRWCAAILFYMTRLLAKGGLQLPAFGIRRAIVVSFLTTKEIRIMFDDLPAGSTLVDQPARIPAEIPIRLFPFFRSFGRLLLVRSVKK